MARGVPLSPLVTTSRREFCLTDSHRHRTLSRCCLPCLWRTRHARYLLAGLLLVLAVGRYKTEGDQYLVGSSRYRQLVLHGKWSAYALRTQIERVARCLASTKVGRSRPQEVALSDNRVELLDIDAVQRLPCYGDGRAFGVDQLRARVGAVRLRGTVSRGRGAGQHCESS